MEAKFDSIEHLQMYVDKYLKDNERSVESCSNKCTKHVQELKRELNELSAELKELKNIVYSEEE